MTVETAFDINKDTDIPFIDMHVLNREEDLNKNAEIIVHEFLKKDSQVNWEL